MSRWRTGRQAVFAAAFAAVIGVESAYAFTVTPGNHPEPDEENILLNTGTSGPTVSGTTNQTNVVVNFTAGGVELVLPSNGQARIEAVEGATFTELTTTPELANFRDLIININIAETGQGQVAEVQFTAQTLNGQEQDPTLFPSALVRTSSRSSPITATRSSPSR